jgi:flavorubredoxin
MGIIKYFRKKYWEAAIFRGGRRIPFSCDGLAAVPDRAYALFTEKELEKIYNDRNEFYKKLMQMIDSY